jgi:hypothetical protein
VLLRCFRESDICEEELIEWGEGRNEDIAEMEKRIT